ncbi:hypothetical protein K461DRAFT_328504 [Myriangium duriaei CBS 260.36]|uniref:Calcium uniporter protein n=1 Tax=Myriangium duriaei CBS 260.36 TaxID=1168546 RepID=A0A9P4MFE0_9PEZI|nr:hypothetical protein K461DRAFT_328504 [Myriangium duriaei CBS 260.36]
MRLPQGLDSICSISNQCEVTESSYARPAHELSQNVTDEEKAHYSQSVEDSKKAQMRSPWTRKGSDVPPAEVDEPQNKTPKKEQGKGKLLTTPSRMLKLILPLTRDGDEGVEPLALLVHPQQPLSYLERLIQSELPAITDDKGREKVPTVTFRAEDPGEDDQRAHKRSRKDKVDSDDADAEYLKIDGKLEKTGKLNGRAAAEKAADKDASSSPMPDELHGRTFIRWSPSTEIGDFIRDASLGNIFTVSIEGRPAPILVGVPSFDDRTFYLRMRLRKVAKRIAAQASLKSECDKAAHRSAQRVAQAGFAGLIGWWYLVYRLTFETELGWDVMEPVTYLVGLSTLIGGYMWFLYHNREVSYRAAMNLTVSRRQSKLYAEKGFDLRKWEGLVEEGNRLRREIKMVADEYDTEWDESEEGGEEVKEALREERKKEKREGKKEDRDGGEEGDGKKD